MAKVAVITAPGCEEGETLTIVDVLRRAEIACDMVGLGAQEIAGTHHIAMRCDTVFDGSLDAYDMVVLPGGYGGSDAMRDSDELIATLQAASKRGAWICAICAAPRHSAAPGCCRASALPAIPACATRLRTRAPGWTPPS